MDDIFKSLAMGGLTGMGGQLPPALMGTGGGAIGPLLGQDSSQPMGSLAGGFAAPMLQGSGGMQGLAQSMGGAQGQSAVPFPMLLGALRAGGLPG